jgi:hypothetical protein
MTGVSGLPGGGIDPRSQGLERLPTEQTPVSRGEQRPIPHGSVVEGIVLRADENGEYLVSVAGRQMRALSNLPLLVGQRFRALWDASGDVPLLRLSEKDSALLARVPFQDRELAAALLSRGLPASQDVLQGLRAVWLRLGGSADMLGSLVELWARDLPLTFANVQLVAWYAALQEKQLANLWKRLRENLQSGERLSSRDGEPPGAAALAGDDEELSRFLRAHGFLSKSARQGIDPALLAPARWPLDEDVPAFADVAAHLEEREGRKIWRVAFEMEGVVLGLVGGEVTTDGNALAVGLGTSDEETAALFRERLPELMGELATLPLRVARVGVFPRKDGVDPMAYRGVDVQA